MLQLMRRKATSWYVWVPFGILIAVFVFFFGYTKASRHQYAGQPPVAVVNDVPISRGEFTIALNNATGYYEQLFKGNVPPQFRAGLHDSVLQQLIQHKLLAHYAQDHGFAISDGELATKIRALPFLHDKDTPFDPLHYRTQFLPGFNDRYQLSFEEWLRSQLIVDQLRTFTELATYTSPAEIDAAQEQAALHFTFEIVRVDPAALFEQKKIATLDDGEKTAQTIQAVFDKPQARTPLLETYGLKPETIGPIDVTQRSRVLGAEATLEQYTALFALTPEQGNCAAPVKTGPVYIVCRLTTRASNAAKKNPPDENLATTYRTKLVDTDMSQLLQSLVAQAKIERHGEEREE